MNLRIQARQWLKNGISWYTPSTGVDLSQYKNFELLQRHYGFDIFIAWNEEKDDGRIFSGTWNEEETLINIETYV